MPGLSAYAGGSAQQVNIAGDNYGSINYGGSPAPAPSLHQLPPGIHDFSGRSADILEIERIASTPGGGPCIVNVYGAPGIGKSALTVQVAQRLAERFDEVQLYAGLGELDGQAPTPAQILQRFVAALDPATTGIPVAAPELPARYRSLLSGRRCLVVLDNAQSADQIADLIPGTAKSAVLVTSRAFVAAPQGGLAYHLGSMTHAESLELLSKVSGRTWPDGQPPDAAGVLINQSGRLPLALRIVGAILKKKPHWTLDKVAADLAGEQTRLAKLTEGPLNVRSCFEVSYQQLSAPEARAFRLLSMLPLRMFKLRHAASFLEQPEDEAEQIVETLVDAQLLETDDGKFFRFHDLLWLYARERSQAAGDDPDGARVARFFQAFTGEFMASYTRCLRENNWTGPLPLPGPPGWPADEDADEKFRAPPDALYIATRLVSADGPHPPERSWHDVLAVDHRVLVLGTAGMGKTILADRICYEIATSRKGTQPYYVGFAVPLRLRSDDSQNLETLIADAVRARYRLEVPQEALAVLLGGQSTVVIFDGFDEVPAPSRGEVARQIGAFCDAYPSVRVVVTSRPGLALVALIAARFRLYNIAPLTHADIAGYIRGWSHVVDRPHTTLLDEISSSSVRRDWLASPLLMTQLIATYDRTGRVPRREIELYDVTYNVLFGSRESSRGLSRGLPPPLMGRLVTCLAYELKAHAGLHGISESEFRRIMESSAAFPDGYGAAEVSENLATLELPVRRVPETTAGGELRWSVTRDPFSEYLAARWVVSASTSADIINRLITMIEADNFIAGIQFTAQLLDGRSEGHKRAIARDLRDVLLGRSRPFPPSISDAIAKMLSSLE